MFISDSIMFGNYGRWRRGREAANKSLSLSLSLLQAVNPSGEGSATRVLLHSARFPVSSTVQRTIPPPKKKKWFVLLSENFLPKIQNVGLEISHFGEFGGKLISGAPIILFVGNLQLSGPPTFVTLITVITRTAACCVGTGRWYRFLFVIRTVAVLMNDLTLRPRWNLCKTATTSTSLFRCCGFLLQGVASRRRRPWQNLFRRACAVASDDVNGNTGSLWLESMMQWPVANVSRPFPVTICALHWTQWLGANALINAIDSVREAYRPEDIQEECFQANHLVRLGSTSFVYDWLSAVNFCTYNLCRLSRESGTKNLGPDRGFSASVFLGRYGAIKIALLLLVIVVFFMRIQLIILNEHYSDRCE